ncbi:four and a half LIM domains protein 1-like [Oncorhynchus nerka]|uniref:four and a half LIM domains protein 1-like n=1 Tax=Oncorhynchus nerka TaxID=8023 RepID=UPI0031B83AFE
MTAFPGKTRMTLGQLCAAIWDTQSQPDVMQPRITLPLCGNENAGKKYVQQEEKPVCVRCHDRFCANTCTEYRHPIGIDSKELQHKGPYWHADCFRCYKSLAKESFSAKEDGIICGKCSSREDAPRCHTCYKSILAGSENVEYKGDVWHEDCFTCFHSPVKGHWPGTRFTSHEEKAFCVNCYKTTVAKKGSGCQNPITGFGKATNVVNYEGSSWHEYCFNCKKCSLSVASKCIVANSRDIFCSECAKKL